MMPVIGALMCSVAAAAQTTEKPPAPPPERGTIGLPLPQIGLPHPPMGLPPAKPPVKSLADQETSREPSRRERQRPVVAVYPWPYGWIAVDPAANRARPADAVSQTARGTESAPPEGRLRVLVEPRVDQQVYVDGYYVGDFDAAREGLPVNAGTHTLEIRADGYETLEVPVQLEAGRSITYRGRLSLRANVPAPEAPEASRTTEKGSMTFYVIPGCYMGNVPPEDAGLPASCDVKKTVTVAP